MSSILKKRRQTKLPLSEPRYVIYAANRGFWRHDSKGYCNNLAIAGIYNAKDAEEICICCGSERQERAIPLEEAYVELAKQSIESDKVVRKIKETIFDVQMDKVLS